MVKRDFMLLMRTVMCCCRQAEVQHSASVGDAWHGEDQGEPQEYDGVFPGAGAAHGCDQAVRGVRHIGPFRCDVHRQRRRQHRYAAQNATVEFVLTHFDYS